MNGALGPGTLESTGVVADVPIATPRSIWNRYANESLGIRRCMGVGVSGLMAIPTV